MQLSTEGNPESLLSLSSYYPMMLKVSLEDTCHTGLQEEDSHGSCISKGIYALSTMSGTQYTLCNTSVQSLSHVQLFATQWTAARQDSPSITNSQRLLKCVSIESVMPSNHLILCHPLLLPPSIFLSIRFFSKSLFFTSGGQRIRVSASASVLPMNIQDWFPLGWTGLIFSPRHSQESSPTPQFKSINSSVLSFIYSPTLIHTWLLEKPFD